ncbi:hypothetical protein G7K_4484-t1 [Saitoella complicata NRRL Y-17804]|uniref:Uncharacterized protein n=1 Tax=Saitoella complicata (strain BCRC 22490 / CBS 7301 / JCM 7358 / NBRC 10748 / NRRL Y-17804) TaxID=698492 RepID=A0A0E9NKE8_SAICN|nr:hypothetical protein G7K_4484-t1 [Saitoella complicata NRRL Y-17804]
MELLWRWTNSMRMEPRRRRLVVLDKGGGAVDEWLDLLPLPQAASHDHGSQFTCDTYCPTLPNRYGSIRSLLISDLPLFCVCFLLRE